MTRTPIYEDPTWQSPTPDSPYGSIVSGFEIEQHLAQTIRTWIPDYLSEIERQRGLPVGKLPPFRTEVATSFEADRLREDQLPALAIVSRGLADRPEVYNSSDGAYVARWGADCIAVCSGRANRQARRLAQWYAAAMRAILVQPRGLDPITELSVLAIDWLMERYTTRTPVEERTLGEGIVSVQVQVVDITYRNAGPSPMFAPGHVGLLPEVLTHDVVVEHSLNEPEEE